MFRIFIVCLAGCGGLSAFGDTDPGSPWPSDSDTQDTDLTDSGEETDVDTGDPDTADTADTADTGVDTGEPDPVGALLISEIVDHAEVGNIKAVELYNPGPGSVDLGRYFVHRWSNGGTTSQRVQVASVTLGPGKVFVLANAGNGVAAFQDTYGRDADQFSGIINGNGDDAYGLYEGDVLVDLFGVVGEAGGTWTYTDSVASRKASVSLPSTSWRGSEWVITPGSGAIRLFQKP